LRSSKKFGKILAQKHGNHKALRQEAKLTESIFSTRVVRHLLRGLLLKKILIALGAVVLAPVLVVGLVALAAGDWRLIGETAKGDKVFVSSIHILKNNQRTALLRVEFKEPAKLPQGGPFVEMRASVRFNCNSRAATPSGLWFYTRDRSGRIVVSRKAKRDDEFGQEREGGFGEMLSRHVCGSK
jgi:hypothetical protein